MRVVVVGATGNVGAALVGALSADPAVESVVGIARRRPGLELPKLEWRSADVVTDDLAPHFVGADAVVHLAWSIQPSRDARALRAVNVDGSRRVFSAVARAGVPNLIYASSVGAYSPGPKDQPVDESWPTAGVETSFYSRHKAEVETILDTYEAEHPDVRAVRMRPGLIFGREAATGIRRLFLGPLFPGSVLRPGLIPVVPALERLVFQAVHRDDVAEAYRLAVHADVGGAFNIAAAPVLDPDRLAELFDARRIRVSAKLLRAGALLTWRAHLQPTPPGWLDMGLAVPVMDTSRARTTLGWAPQATAVETLSELVEGLQEGAGFPTPPLDPRSSGPLRVREFRTGIGARA